VSPGLRERKKRETRLALSLAAVQLVVERGWNNVTIEDIAAAANVSDRTFRNYFSSKAEAIASRHLDRTLQIADDLRERPADEPLWDSIIKVVLAQYSTSRTTRASDRESDGEALRAVLAEPAMQGEILKVNAVAQAELAHAIAERTGTDASRDLYPKLVAGIVNAATAVAIEHALSTPTHLTRALRDVFAQISRGLPVP
jgi:AcrR family transcriptional regulator